MDQTSCHIRTQEMEKVVQIRPNCSLSHCQARNLLAVLVGSTLLVSGSIALAGFWMVLPFAGLELLVFFVALRITMLRGDYREVVRISSSQIVIEKGEKNIQERVEFPRYWATVRLLSSPASTSPDRLVIGYQGRMHEIGKCLTDSERLGLDRYLRKLVGMTGQLPELSGPVQ